MSWISSSCWNNTNVSLFASMPIPFCPTGSSWQEDPLKMKQPVPLSTYSMFQVANTGMYVHVHTASSRWYSSWLSVHRVTRRLSLKGIDWQMDHIHLKTNYSYQYYQYVEGEMQLNLPKPANQGPRGSVPKYIKCNNPQRKRSDSDRRNIIVVNRDQ